MIAEFALQEERDVELTARRARLLGLLAGLSRRRRGAFSKAVSEVARRAIAHGGGQVAFGIAAVDGRHAVEVLIRCHLTVLSGTSSFAAADMPAAAAATSAWQLAFPFVDEFTITNDPQHGTLIRLTHDVPAPLVPLLEREAARWSETLSSGTVEGALEVAEGRIRQLTESLLEAEIEEEQHERELQDLRGLNERLELLALVASKTDNAVIILNAAGDVDWVNDSFARIMGLSLAQTRGQRLANVLYALDRTAHQQLCDTLASGQGLSQETQVHRADGQSRWIYLSVTPISGEDGRITRWIGLAQDITKRREAQSVLEQAKEAAETASRAKTEFLANISHEIRTPMNVIIGMTELSLGTRLTKEQREYLTAVKTSADSLLRLLNDILDLSKIEAGKLPIEAIPFHLPGLLEDVLMPLQHQAEQKGLRLTCQLPPNVPTGVVGDPVRLRQVLLNLVDNAIKFTETGEIAVAVEVASDKRTEAVLNFQVRDTGIGIPPEMRQRIFEAFTQADSSTTRRFGGTGLGLTISTQLVEIMGGRIWVESEQGQGSTFRFSLPLKTQRLRGSRSERPRRRTTSEGPPRILRVLVADDNPANRLLAARILEKRGHIAVPAENGQQVLDLTQRETFDAVLMDAQMPELDGIEATIAIRTRERQTQTHLPVIAMTAAAMDEDRQRCLASGMDGYISKPINAQDLLTLVETIGTGIAGGAALAGGRVAEPGGFDFSAALARVEGDWTILREQIEYFLRDAPGLLAGTRTAIQQGQARDVHALAHRLKGLAAGFDAEAVTDAASRLEQLGRDDDLADAAPVCDGLDVQLHRLCEALARFRGSGGTRANGKPAAAP